MPSAKSPLPRDVSVFPVFILFDFFTEFSISLSFECLESKCNALTAIPSGACQGNFRHLLSYWLKEWLVFESAVNQFCPTRTVCLRKYRELWKYGIILASLLLHSCGFWLGMLLFSPILPHMSQGQLNCILVCVILLALSTYSNFSISICSLVGLGHWVRFKWK